MAMLPLKEAEKAYDQLKRGISHVAVAKAHSLTPYGLRKVIESYMNGMKRIIPEPNEIILIKKPVQISVYAIPGVKPEFMPEKLKNGEIGYRIEHIIDVILGYMKVEMDELQNKRRYRKLSYTRQLIFYFGRRKTNESLIALGKIFGYDHSTVVHSCNTISSLYQTNESVQADVNNIKLLL